MSLAPFRCLQLLQEPAPWLLTLSKMGTYFSISTASACSFLLATGVKSLFFGLYQTECAYPCLEFVLITRSLSRDLKSQTKDLPVPSVPLTVLFQYSPVSVIFP